MQEENELSNCWEWDDRTWLKGRPEVESINKWQPFVVC